jgi:hypothetical protein
MPDTYFQYCASLLLFALRLSREHNHGPITCSQSLLLLFKFQTRILPSSFHLSLLRDNAKGDPYHLDFISYFPAIIDFLFFDYFLKMMLFVDPVLSKGVFPGARETSNSAFVALNSAYNLLRARRRCEIRRLLVSRSPTDPRLVIRKSLLDG